MKPEHARERRPQLVRDDADELGLHPLALAELLVLLLELVVARLESLGHLVERTGQLADLARPLLRKPQRVLATGDPPCAISHGPHRATDRACEDDAEQGDQRHRGADGDRADENRDVGALVRVAGCLGGEPVLLRPEDLEEPTDLVCLHLARLRQRGVVSAQARHLLEDRDQWRRE